MHIFGAASDGSPFFCNVIKELILGVGFVSHAFIRTFAA